MAEVGDGVASTPPDEPLDEVTAALRSGSREAMTRVFNDHLDVIYNYCYRRCGSWAAAEDLTATVFLEVWRHRQRAISVDGSVLPWVYGIATNVCRNHHRSQLRHASAVTRLIDVNAQPADHTEAVADRFDNQRRLRNALDRVRELPQGDQEVFVLVCWEELSYAAAAAALQIPVGTVRSRLARVRRILRLTDTARPERREAFDA